MDSSSSALVRKGQGLSAEGVVPSLQPHTSAPSPNFYTGSKKGGSLDYYKKKVGQLSASSSKTRCENPQGMYFICEHGHVVYRTVSCHARFMTDCSSCAKRWRRKTIKRFTKRINKMEYPALVSLTLRKPLKRPLKEINRLTNRCKKYLRRTCRKRGGCKLRNGLRCKKNCKLREGYKLRGFVSCIELPNHIHIVLDCGFIPQTVLSEVWRQVTKDSYVVDIRKVGRRCRDDAVHYITKYITRICKNGSGVALAGVHVVNSWGLSGGCVKSRMMCVLCGSPFEFFWYAGQVEDYENDDVDFVEVDNDHG